MSLRIQLWMVFLAPVILMGGLYAFGLTIPVPHFGRDYVLRLLLPDTAEQVGLPTVYGPQDASRPLVLIDPGHGGHDPGASGAGFKEKTLALGLAKALKNRLVEEGGIRVAMTREDDIYLLPAERDDLARRLGANLFISIHADSAGEQSGVTGASIYTLSNTASSEAAARFAARENAADQINGVSVGTREDGVEDILVELSQRRTQAGSVEFATLAIREGEDVIRFHPQAKRSAALAVLRAPDVPSVLFESGFISNPEEARRLASTEGRAQFADVMARTIRIFFARQSGQ
ncbi:N-acetylmuramoyl-L-alanine amidase [Altererythrobacter sp. ZODW24]|uniref:N-acetylmuramoyl-L-alanine amidase family protein n=1 Tax=Altererythrobacter sp. ZODW24 TaxID=2185142 RepID=UPI000DF7A674|nr:N-acetylmuramoyl-L-alanine amidase [Altererythrobacter sp. ZODW24]